mgnify:CR=1 FL=1
MQAWGAWALPMPLIHWSLRGITPRWTIWTIWTIWITLCWYGCIHCHCSAWLLFFKIFCLKRFNYRGRIHRRVVFDCWTQIHSGSDQWLLAMLSYVCDVALWRGWLLCNDLLPPARAIICMLMANGPLSSQLIRPGYHCCWSSPDNTISNCLSASDNRFRNIVLDARSQHWQLI